MMPPRTEAQKIDDAIDTDIGWWQETRQREAEQLDFITESQED